MKIPDKFRSKVQEAANSHSVIAITDADGVIVYVNENFEKLSGYSSKELVGQTHKIVNSGLHSKSFFTDLWRQILSGKTWVGYICNRNKSGDLYWVDTTIYPAIGDDGNIKHFISIRTDISKVVFDRNQQRQFRQNAELLNQLVEINIPEFSLQKVLEESLKLLLQLSWLSPNKKGAIYLASQDEQFELVTSNNFTQKDITSVPAISTANLTARAIREDRTIYVNCLDEDQKRRPKNGDPQPHLYMPIKGSGGAVAVLVLYLEKDATRKAEHESFLDGYCHTLGLIIENRQQRQHMQMAFVDAVRMQGIADRAREDAEYAAGVKADFLASMSHEIRTPMNGVLGMLGLLDGTKLSDDQRELVDIANNSANSLMTIINDILDFSKYERQGFTLEEEPIKLQEEFKQILLPLQNQARHKLIDLEIYFAENLPDQIIGDITRLGQVLINLISNAIKFTETGAVKLDVSIGQKQDIEMLIISVSDTGIGMSQEAQSTVFDRFSQADNSITRKFGGTGLGLAIVKQLAEAMSGSVNVQSTLGEGSIFTFSFPLNVVKTEPLAISLEDEEELSGPLKILVAEDHPANQFLLRKLLEAADHQVTIVENGELAVDEFNNNSFDLILMDVRMPVMDGLCATRLIRQSDGVNAMVPIIAVTADVMPEQVVAILAAGANAHIGKPINPTELFQAIAEYGHKKTLDIQQTNTA